MMEAATRRYNQAVIFRLAAVKTSCPNYPEFVTGNESRYQVMGGEHPRDQNVNQVNFWYVTNEDWSFEGLSLVRKMEN
jgi:hypothetical protein